MSVFKFYRAVMPQYVVRPSVCPSVTFRYPDRIGWNYTSKIISPPIGLKLFGRKTIFEVFEPM